MKQGTCQSDRRAKQWVGVGGSRLKHCGTDKKAGKTRRGFLES